MTPADVLASRLTDRQVGLLAAVTIAMCGGDVPALSYAEWCEAERLMGEVDGEETRRQNDDVSRVGLVKEEGGYR